MLIQQSKEIFNRFSSFIFEHSPIYFIFYILKFDVHLAHRLTYWLSFKKELRAYYNYRAIEIIIYKYQLGYFQQKLFHSLIEFGSIQKQSSKSNRKKLTLVLMGVGLRENDAVALLA